MDPFEIEEDDKYGRRRSRRWPDIGNRKKRIVEKAVGRPKKK